MAKTVQLSITVPISLRDDLVRRAATADLPVKPATLAAHLLTKAMFGGEGSTYDARLTLTEREAYGVASALIPIPGLASRIVAELTKRGASRERCAAILDALGLDMPPAPAQAGGRAVNSGGAL